MKTVDEKGLIQNREKAECTNCKNGLVTYKNNVFECKLKREDVKGDDWCYNWEDADEIY